MMHKIILTVLFLFLANPVQADIRTGLVAWWRMNEASSGACAGATVVDSTRNANTGTCNSSPTYVAGRIGPGALNFDGVNDYVSISNSSSITPSYITVSFWFKLNALTTTTVSGGASTSSMYVLGKANNTATDDAYVVYKSSGHLLYFHVKSYLNAAVSTTSLSAGSWYFFTGTYDGANIKTYLNGVLEGTTGYAGGTIAYDSTALTIGRRYTASGYNAYFNGIIDELRIYSRALTDADVLQLYKSMPNKLSNVKLSNMKITE